MITETSAGVRGAALFGALSDVSQMLATTFRYPTKTVVEQLVNPEFCDILTQLQVDIGAATNASVDDCAIKKGLPVGRMVNEGLLSEIRSAYTALFTHPQSPTMPPYESQYLYWRSQPDGTFDDAPRMFVCPAAVDAERIYKKAGLTRSRELNEPGDFIATELEFVANIFSRMGELSVSSQSHHNPVAELEWLNEVYREFSHYHIQKWWRRFFEELAASAVHPFYSLMGGIGTSMLSVLVPEPQIGEEHKS